jgi:tetratricopeptide (TPR) repeat protein
VRETELARQALEKAMDLTRQWGDRYPWVHLYRNLAQVLVEQGKYDQAIAAATMGLDTGEQNRRSMLFWICAANLARGDQEQAEAQLALFEEELHRKGMADILVSMNVGLIYKKAGCTEGVLPRMEAAVAAEPTFFPAVSWLAALQDDAGRPEAAVACLDSFLAHDPEHPEAHMQLALIRAANDLDLDEAVSRLELMRSSHPELVNPEFLRVLGAAYLRQDRSQLAVRTLEEAWDLLPQYDHETYLTLQAARKAAEGAAL